MVKDLEMGRLTWLSGWALNTITCVLIRGRQKESWWQEEAIERDRNDVAMNQGEQSPDAEAGTG
jgi:hypothetical protein